MRGKRNSRAHDAPKNDQQVTKLLWLNTFAEKVLATLSYDTIVRIALQELKQLLEADTVFMLRVEHERMVLHDIHPAEYRDSINADGEHFFNECLCGIAAAQRSTVYSKDIHYDARCSRKECKLAGFTSFAALPLRNRGELFGIIGVATTEKTDFKLQAELIESIAHFISLSLTNAIHYEHVQKETHSRKHVEQRLRENLDTYRLLVENQTDLIVKVDANGRFLFVSPSYCTLFGKSEAQLIGKEFMPLVHEDDKRATEQAMQKLSSPPYTCYLEQRAMTRYGWRWIAWADKAVVDDRGTVTAIIGVGRDVTEQKETQEELELFKTSVESSSDAIGMSTPDGTHYYQNETFTHLFGDIGTNARVIYADQTVADQVFDTIMQGGQWLGEVEVFDKEGNIRNILLRAYAGYDGQGRIANLTGIHTDITERKRMEHALRDSEQRYKETARFLDSLFNVIPDVIGVQDSDHNIIRYNQAGYDFLGKSHEEVVGKKCYELIGRKIPCDICATSIAYKTKQSAHVEKYIPELDIYLDVYAYPILNEHGHISMVIEHLHDNTARIKAEKATETEKERLAVTLRSIGDGVITTDTDGRVLLINRVAEELTGWPQEEACGRPIGEVFHIINELSRKPWENPVQKVLESGNIIELANHTLLISRQGTERIIADSGAPIKDVSGSTIGVVLVFRDMTEKQKLIDATQKNQKLEALGVLAAGIAHDFNNLLGGVFGYIDLAKQEMQDAGHSPQYLDDAVSAVERARGLTAQLLTFAKGSAPIIKAGSIATVIKEAVQFALSGTNVSATFAFDSILGSALFDKNQISQVIDNMVINATHAMPRGGEIIVSGSTVHIEEKQHPELPAGEYVKISIADSGIGIPKDILPNIFDPFFTTKAKGSGLGLATSYSILKKHGGTIEVESQQGKGTTFHLYVPATGDAQGTTEDSAQGLHTGKGHILVMDDEMVLRRVLTKMLEKCGYTVETASTGEQALARYSEAKKHGPAFDAVILDLTISGGMGGRETVKRLRDMGETIPVFVASGYASEEIMAEPERFGFTASLSKPFMMRELSDMLHTHIIKEP